MLVGLVCDCSGATQIIRRTLKSAGVSYWLDVPIYRGKKGYRAFVSSLPSHIKDLYGFQILETSMKSLSSYAIIVGITDKQLIFSNIRRGEVSSRIEAEVIAEKFA